MPATITEGPLVVEASDEDEAVDDAAVDADIAAARAARMQAEAAAAAAMATAAQAAEQAAAATARAEKIQAEANAAVAAAAEAKQQAALDAAQAQSEARRQAAEILAKAKAEAARLTTGGGGGRAAVEVTSAPAPATQQVAAVRAPAAAAIAAPSLSASTTAPTAGPQLTHAARKAAAEAARADTVKGGVAHPIQPPPSVPLSSNIQKEHARLDAERMELQNRLLLAAREHPATKAWATGMLNAQAHAAAAAAPSATFRSHYEPLTAAARPPTALESSRSVVSVVAPTFSGGDVTPAPSDALRAATAVAHAATAAEQIVAEVAGRISPEPRPPPPSNDDSFGPTPRSRVRLITADGQVDMEILAALTERLRAMHTAAHLTSAQYEALCDYVGDFGRDPAGSGPSAVTRAAVRLAASFSGDDQLARQLLRTVFPMMERFAKLTGGAWTSPSSTIPATSAQSSPEEAGGGSTPANLDSSRLVIGLQKEVSVLQNELHRLQQQLSSTPSANKRSSPEALLAATRNRLQAGLLAGANPQRGGATKGTVTGHTSSYLLDTDDATHGAPDQLLDRAVQEKLAQLKRDREAIAALKAKTLVASNARVASAAATTRAAHTQRSIHAIERLQAEAEAPPAPAPSSLGSARAVSSAIATAVRASSADSPQAPAVTTTAAAVTPPGGTVKGAAPPPQRPHLSLTPAAASAVQKASAGGSDGQRRRKKKKKPAAKGGAGGGKTIKADMARSLAVACLLRQLGIAELFPLVRSQLGCTTVEELAALAAPSAPGGGDGGGGAGRTAGLLISATQRRRLLRAAELARDSPLREALLHGEALAKKGEVHEAIATCRKAMKLGRRLLASPTSTKKVSRRSTGGGAAPAAAGDSVTPAGDGEQQAAQRGGAAAPEAEQAEPEDREASGLRRVFSAGQEFYCDESGATLCVGGWWHRAGSAYDLCHAEYMRRVAAEPGIERQFVLVRTVADLAADAWRYDTSQQGGGGGGCHVPEGTPPPSSGGGGGGDRTVTALVAAAAPPKAQQLRLDIEKMAAYVKKHGGEGVRSGQGSWTRPRPRTHTATAFHLAYQAR
jgi:hypothetical protein